MLHSRAQLRGQQNIAQGLAELPEAITTVLSRAQAPTRRMLVDQKGLGKPPLFPGREEDFYVWAKNVENYVSGVFPNVRGALTFAVESQDAVTATSVTLGVPEFEAEMSTEIDGQLFIVLSALTDGENHGFESWRKLHRRWDSNAAGRARSLLREILSPLRVKLPELMGAIGRMGDLVRRCCGRRDALGNVHSFSEHIRMSCREALLPDDLEEHVQLNRARLNSYGVLREEIKTYCECGGHAARNAKQKGSSHPGGDDPMDIGAFGKGKGAKASTARAKAKGSKDGKDNKDNKDETRARTRTRRRIRLNVGTVDSADTTRKTVGARRTPTKVVRNESTNQRMQRKLTILTRRNQQKLNQKLMSVNSTWVFSTSMHFNSKSLNGSRLESTQVQERRHGPRVSHTGRSSLVMLTSLSAQRLESLSNLVSDCTLKVATIGESISEFEVFKRQCVDHCCLSESTRRWVESLSCMVTKVTCSTRVRMLRGRSMRGSRRR